MKQVFILHGGTSFNTYQRYLDGLKHSTIEYERLKQSPSWKDWLSSQLPNNFTLLCPSFPNKENAVYEEWKIYFEKLIPFFDRDTQLIGYSLGGMFLAKYLHEITLPIKLKRIILLAPGYNDESNEDLGSFTLSSAKGIEMSAREVHFMHSKDDPLVPFSELAKFQRDAPTATAHIFSDVSHFFIDEFPELLELLQQK